MKIICTLIAATFLSAGSVLAQDAAAKPSGGAEAKKIAATEADKHINETMVVTGKVAQVSVREKLVYLNLDKNYPESPFTGVIFAKSTNGFGDLKLLKGKSVEIKGKIEEYHDKPQIVLTSTNQLKVLEGSAPAEEKK